MNKPKKKLKKNHPKFVPKSSQFYFCSVALNCVLFMSFGPHCLFFVWGLGNRTGPYGPNTAEVGKQLFARKTETLPKDKNSKYTHKPTPQNAHPIQEKTNNPNKKSTTRY